MNHSTQDCPLVPISDDSGRSWTPLRMIADLFGSGEAAGVNGKADPFAQRMSHHASTGCRVDPRVIRDTPRRPAPSHRLQSPPSSDWSAEDCAVGASNVAFVVGLTTWATWTVRSSRDPLLTQSCQGVAAVPHDDLGRGPQAA